MPLVAAAPNIERTGVIAGFVLSLGGAGLTPAITKGILFAQGSMYRPALTPILPAAPASQQSWLFYNFGSAWYWASSFTPATVGDAFVGWVVTNASEVIAVSAQRIGETGAGPAVLPSGSVQPDESGSFIPPGDVAIISCTGHDDGNSHFVDVEYQPPGTDASDIVPFTGVKAYVEAPDGSGVVQFGGDFPYDGDADGEVEFRYGKCRLVLPLTVAEDRRVYLVSRSAVWTNALVLYDVDHPEEYATPNALVTVPASGVILNPPALNQTPITVGANRCRVVLVARGNRTKYQFAGSVRFATSAAKYSYLTRLEVFADNADGVANDRLLGNMTPPAAGQGDVVELFYTDEWDLPTDANDTWGLEFHAYNIDNLMTPDPPRVEGLIVPCDTTAPPPDVDPVAIPPVTAFSVSDWGMDAAQEFRLFVCTWTLPTDMANVSGVKFRIATPDLPGGQDVTGSLPYPKVAAGLVCTNGHMIQIERDDLPVAAENWTFSCVTINAAGDGHNLTAPAPTDVLSVGPPSGAVPDLVPPLLPVTVTGADTGTRLLLGNNEPYTWIRATVTLPARHRAQFLLLWVSEDGGATWGSITQQWAVGSGLSYNFVMRVPATAQTDWKVKVTTGSEQATNDEGTAVVSSAFPVATVAATTPTGATAASVGAFIPAKDAEGAYHWGLSYVKWTTPPNDPNFLHSQLTVQLVNGSGTPDPGSDLGFERPVDESSLVGVEYTSYGVFNWWIPPASYGYRNHRFRIYGVNVAGVRTLYTGCWPGGANYYDVVPAEQTGALQVQRADPTVIGSELSIGAAVAGGAQLLRFANTNVSNILPNADFQLAHPTTSSWPDKWTAYNTATRQTGAEVGSYLIRLGYHASGSGVYSEKVRVSVGQRYSLSARVKADATPGGSFAAFFRFLTPAGVSCGADATFNAGVLTTSWATIGYSANVPSGVDAYYMEVHFDANPDNGKYYYIDRAEVTLVVVQQDLYSAGVTTAVTLGQHLNADAQFVGVGVARSTGWKSEQRDDHFELKCPSGRVVAHMYGLDGTVDAALVIVKSDTASGYPMVTMESANPGVTVALDVDHSIFFMFNGSEARLYMNGVLKLSEA